jgi:taurine dioxygenase
MEIKRLSHALGALVTGLDLTERVSDADFATVHKAFLENGVLVFRGKEITREQHIAFSRRFGELDIDKSPDSDPQFPELTIVTTRPQADGKPSESRYTGQLWHTDIPFSLTPALGSLLRCVERPDVGGDTQFANMYLAYDTLSDGMKKILDGLEGIHQRARKFTGPVSAERETYLKTVRPVAQPAVRVHPETGRKALYLGEKVKQFVGLTEAESAPLLEYLNKHAFRPQFVYRHTWQKNDIVMWDNRCMQHLAVGDVDPTAIRHMERTTIRGTPSGHYVEAA